MTHILNSFLWLIGGLLFGILDFRVAGAEDIFRQQIDFGENFRSGVTTLLYFFNAKIGACVPFMYKGCGGNKNRFNSADECKDDCALKWHENRSKKAGELKSNEFDQDIRPASDCFEKVDTGPCKAKIPSWHYEMETGRCHAFKYGGCLGTKNRFNKGSQCKNVCVKKNG